MELHDLLPIVVSSAVVSALVSGLFSLLLARSNRNADKEERRRRELLDLVTGFLADADALWRAAQRLNTAVLSMTGSNNLFDQHWAGERLAAFEDRRGPERSAEVGIMTFRIVAPRIVEPAEAVRRASIRYQALQHEEFEQTRDDAVAAFVHAVQAEIKRR